MIEGSTPTYTPPSVDKASSNVPATSANTAAGQTALGATAGTTIAQANPEGTLNRSNHNRIADQALPMTSPGANSMPSLMDHGTPTSGAYESDASLTPDSDSSSEGALPTRTSVNYRNFVDQMPRLPIRTNDSDSEEEDVRLDSSERLAENATSLATTSAANNDLNLGSQFDRMASEGASDTPASLALYRLQRLRTSSE